jgi:hypothetical protein
VFEIGNSLREARIRRELDFAQAEVATKIRAKYLRALEDEQFEILPAETYVKGFLRTYAEYLGLDGQLYVDEFNSRFVSGDDHEPRVRRSAARPPRRSRHIGTSLFVIALAAVAVVIVVVIAAWKNGGSEGPATTTTTAAVSTPPGPQKAPALLTLRPLRGSTHVIAHAGSATGKVVFDGTLSAGDHAVAIDGVRLWVSIDAPENLTIEVLGKPVHVPGLRPQVGIVTAGGWRSA